VFERKKMLEEKANTKKVLAYDAGGGEGFLPPKGGELACNLLHPAVLDPFKA